MNSLGGAAQFHSFHGCILDVRYWSKQRSSKEIRGTMHRLINLTENLTNVKTKKTGKLKKRSKSAKGVPENDSTDENLSGQSSTDASGAESGDEETESEQQGKAKSKSKDTTGRIRSGRRKRKKSLKKKKVDVSSAGLIGWWAFEEGYVGGGKGGNRVFDLTEHRFKTPIVKNIELLGYLPKQKILQIDAHSPAIPLEQLTFSRPESPEELTQTKLKSTILTAESIINEAINVRRSRGFTWIDTACLLENDDEGFATDPNVVPLPSYRMRNICPYELHRFRLAQAGRLLHREIECPFGIKKKN